MLLVKTFIKESPVHGIGLFADEFIPKGKKIWVFKYGFDLIITDDIIDGLPEHSKQFIFKYGFYNSNYGYIMCMDDARYTNHSKTHNTKLEGTYLCAAINILKGEEILENYYSYDEHAHNKLKSY
jgi:hypothetical protein